MNRIDFIKKALAGMAGVAIAGTLVTVTDNASVILMPRPPVLSQWFKMSNEILDDKQDYMEEIKECIDHHIGKKANIKSIEVGFVGGWTDDKGDTYPGDFEQNIHTVVVTYTL